MKSLSIVLCIQEESKLYVQKNSMPKTFILYGLYLYTHNNSEDEIQKEWKWRKTYLDYPNSRGFRLTIYSLFFKLLQCGDINMFNLNSQHSTSNYQQQNQHINNLFPLKTIDIVAWTRITPVSSKNEPLCEFLNHSTIVKTTNHMMIRKCTGWTVFKRV